MRKSTNVTWLLLIAYIIAIAIIIMAVLLALTACDPTPTPTPTPTLEPTPKPIQYLIIKENTHAPVWPEPGAQQHLGIYLKDGDAVPIRNQRDYQGWMWYEVLCGDLFQFPPGTTGWVKFKEDKMYLEVRGWGLDLDDLCYWVGVVVIY